LSAATAHRALYSYVASSRELAMERTDHSRHAVGTRSIVIACCSVSDRFCPACRAAPASPICAADISASDRIPTTEHAPLRVWEPARVETKTRTDAEQRCASLPIGVSDLLRRRLLLDGL
jgi:hypothetical protein